MGLAILALLAAVTILALLWWARPTRPVALALLATVAAGSIGYAWQGRPRLPGQPTGPRANHPVGDPLFAEERLVWLGRVGPDADLLGSADMLIRQGAADYAIGILRGALARSPRDMDLWIGLGNALVTHADGVVTPAARFAFDRAAALAPRHPAPRYFLGLAWFAGGDFEAAEHQWRDLLAAMPPDAPFRPLLQARLATLVRLRALADAGPSLPR